MRRASLRWRTTRSALLLCLQIWMPLLALTAARSEMPLSIPDPEMVSGWAVGRNGSAGGCLAAATYKDETTVWFGLDESNDGLIAFVNPAWKSIQPGKEYKIRLAPRGQGNWNGTFVGFERQSNKGIIALKIKERFLSAIAKAGGIWVYFDGEVIARLNLSGSSRALEEVILCQARWLAGRDGPKTPASRAGSSGKVSTGTGFFVSQRGHILTNYHVIDGCSQFTVSPNREPAVPASLLAGDQTNDLAILSTKLEPSVVPAFNTRTRIGESVFVYGFPLTGVLAKTGNFTSGNVTATAGLRDDTRFMQISAPIQPGNSGGPLVDQSGNILGVITAKLASPEAQNVNFSIKSIVALNFLDSNGLQPSTKVRDQKLEPVNIAELAQEFTVRVECR